MRAGRFLFLFALAFLAGCVSHRHTGGVGNSEFVPTGPVVVMRHIGLVGSVCTSPAPGPLRIEARPAEGVFRILNVTDRSLDVHYDWAASFGDYQMLYIRFRDRTGSLVSRAPADCGWWSPKLNDNNLYGPGNWPERRRLAIPAGGHADIRHDQAALISWWHEGETAPVPPCEMQVRIWGYLEPRSWAAVAADSAWIPAPCPVEPRP